MAPRGGVLAREGWGRRMKDGPAGHSLAVLRIRRAAAAGSRRRRHRRSSRLRTWRRCWLWLWLRWEELGEGREGPVETRGEERRVKGRSLGR